MPPSNQRLLTWGIRARCALWTAISSAEIRLDCSGKSLYWMPTGTGGTWCDCLQHTHALASTSVGEAGVAGPCLIDSVASQLRPIGWGSGHPAATAARWAPMAWPCVSCALTRRLVDSAVPALSPDRGRQPSMIPASGKRHGLSQPLLHARVEAICAGPVPTTPAGGAGLP